MKTTIITLVALLFLSGCHSLEKYEWVGPEVLRGEGGFMKSEDGLEIWVKGEPNRNYIPVKIVEATTSGTIGVESYLFGVFKKETKKLNGDGFVVLSKDVANGGYYSSGTSTTTGIGSIYGNNYNLNATTTSSSFSVPVQYNTYQALVFQYE